MMKNKRLTMQNFNSPTMKSTNSMNQIFKHDPKLYKPSKFKEEFIFNLKQIYFKVTFENSLGKLTTSNFNHPRALITFDKSSHEDIDKQKETKNICTILLEIEKVLQILLKIK